jgi:hypothetical protein
MARVTIYMIFEREIVEERVHVDELHLQSIPKFTHLYFLPFPFFFPVVVWVIFALCQCSESINKLFSSDFAPTACTEIFICIF